MRRPDSVPRVDPFKLVQVTTWRHVSLITKTVISSKRVGVSRSRNKRMKIRIPLEVVCFDREKKKFFEKEERKFKVNFAQLVTVIRIPTVE